MSEYTRVAMRLFHPVTDTINPYFTNLNVDLKKARIKMSAPEYLARGILLSFLIFVIELPLLSFIFSLLPQFSNISLPFSSNFFFGFITALTVSFFLTAIFFFAYVSYPNILIKNRAKNIDNVLPFASLYLSTIASSKLPLFKVFQIFSKFAASGDLAEEIGRIQIEIKLFGIDINTAIEKAIERTPSKSLKELLYGILSTSRSGGDTAVYLKEKSRSFMQEYRRKLYEFSHQLTVFIEVYLTAIVLGAIFFVVLTAILSGISGGGANAIFLQFFLIFIFLPMVSAIFIFFVKSTSPGAE